MASKYQIITELAASTAHEITASPEKYMAFLATAANNFKYSFRNQVLIYAQKPEATACADIKFWNARSRWVNAGTKGIALLDDNDASRRLRYVFDVSNTSSRTRRPVPIWKMREHYEGAVTTSLNRSVGVGLQQGFTEFLIDTAAQAVSGGYPDYLERLLARREGSLLEELDELNTEVWLRDTMKNSVAFMLLTRCGYDAGEFFAAEDFARVYDFNTWEVLSVLGSGASAISETILREVAQDAQKQECELLYNITAVLWIEGLRYRRATRP